MEKAKTSKKLLCLLLSLAMLITMIPGMAFADTSEGSTQVIKRAELFDKNTPIDVVLKKSENDAVTCVCPDTKSFHLRVYANDKDKYTKLYHFDEKSNKWVTEILRNDFGYEGLIISDDILMAALSENGFPPQKAVIMAIEAGVDCIMISQKRFASSAQILYDKAQKDSDFLALLQKASFRVIKYKFNNGLLKL